MIFDRSINWFKPALIFLSTAISTDCPRLSADITLSNCGTKLLCSFITSSSGWQMLLTLAPRALKKKHGLGRKSRKSRKGRKGRNEIKFKEKKSKNKRKLSKRYDECRSVAVIRWFARFNELQARHNNISHSGSEQEYRQWFNKLRGKIQSKFTSAGPFRHRASPMSSQRSIGLRSKNSSNTNKKTKINSIKY